MKNVGLQILWSSCHLISEVCTSQTERENSNLPLQCAHKTLFSEQQNSVASSNYRKHDSSRTKSNKTAGERHPLSKCCRSSQAAWPSFSSLQIHAKPASAHLDNMNQGNLLSHSHEVSYGSNFRVKDCQRSTRSLSLKKA